jgi:hypothetical protein
MKLPQLEDLEEKKKKNTGRRLDFAYMFPRHYTQGMIKLIDNALPMYV